MNATNLASGPFPKSRLDVRQLPMLGADPALASYPHLLAPRSIHLRLTNRCNSACNYCERELQKTGEKAWEGEFTEELWEHAKRAFLPHVEGVELAGLGEPTLSPLFPKIVKDTLAAGKTLYFPTNGQFLATKVTDCLGTGVGVRVSISLDAGTPETYVKLGRGKESGVSSWENTLRSIKAFGKKCPDAFLHSQYTASTQNIDELPQFMAVAAELGIKEVIMRLVQNHATSREEMSLRFAKDRTEAAITTASQVASAAGIWFEAERRPYSVESPNLAGDTHTDALSQMKRYLDFAPMDATPCPGCTPTSSVSTVNSGTTFSIVMQASDCSGCSTSQDVRDVYVNYGTPPANTSSLCTLTTGTTVCTSQNATVLGPGTTQVCTTFNSAVETTGDCSPIQPGFVLTYGSFTSFTTATSVCQTLTCPAPITQVNTPGLGSPETTYVTNFSCTAACTKWFVTENAPAIGTTTLGPYSTGTCTSAADAGPQVVRTVRVPRAGGAFSTQSLNPATPAEEKPVRYADASLIVWADSDLSTCFARHSVGKLDAATTWEGVIMNPRYQAFLHRRQYGHIDQEHTCRNCPKTF